MFAIAHHRSASENTLPSELSANARLNSPEFRQGAINNEITVRQPESITAASAQGIRSNSNQLMLRKKWLVSDVLQRKRANNFEKVEVSPTSSEGSTLNNISNAHDELNNPLESDQSTNNTEREITNSADIAARIKCATDALMEDSDASIISHQAAPEQQATRILNTGHTVANAEHSQADRPLLGSATNTANSTVPACCTEVSLDELSNATNAVNGSGGLPLLPTDIMISAGVTYTCVVGAKVSYDIVKACHEQERVLMQSLRDLDAMVTSKGNSTEAQVMKYFMKHELKDVRHEKWVAGCVSGSSSAIMTVGTFVSACSPIAHFIATANGVGHMANSIRVIHSTRMKLKRIQGNDEVSQTQKAHLKKELILHLKNLGSWTLFAGGSAILGTVTLGALVAAVGGSMSTGALPIVGISLLLPGIVGAFFFNNAVTSKLYSPGLPRMLKEKLQSKELCTLDEIQSNLARAQRNRLLAKEYRTHVSKHESLKSKVLVYTLRSANKAGLLVTLGLMPKTVMKNKRKIKEVATTLFHNSWEKRLDILSRVQASVKSSTTEIKIDSSGDTSINAAPDKLKFFLDKLCAEDKSAGAIGKLLARRVLIRRKQWSLPKQDASKWRKWMPSSTIVTRIEKRYEKILHLGNDRDLDIAPCLHQLLNLSPCCSGNVEAKELFQNLKRYYCDASSAEQTPEFQEKKEALTTLLVQATDQYLFYQVRKEAKEEIAIWTKYLSAFQKAKKNHPSLSSPNFG